MGKPPYVNVAIESTSGNVFSIGRALNSHYFRRIVSIFGLRYRIHVGSSFHSYISFSASSAGIQNTSRIEFYENQLLGTVSSSVQFHSFQPFGNQKFPQLMNFPKSTVSDSFLLSFFWQENIRNIFIHLMSIGLNTIKSWHLDHFWAAILSITSHFVNNPCVDSRIKHQAWKYRTILS